jgi:hypothetical protein
VHEYDRETSVGFDVIRYGPLKVQHKKRVQSTQRARAVMAPVTRPLEIQQQTQTQGQRAAAKDETTHHVVRVSPPSNDEKQQYAAEPP